MFCSNCGRKLPDGAKFCSFCGERVLEAVKVDDAQAPLDFSDLPGADADNKPAEAPVKTRVTFDWSNVIDEPQRRTVQDIKSPWATTGGIDQKEIYEEMKPSTDRSRTMSFIDVLRAEKEQAEAKEKDGALSVEETLAADSSGERPIEYTEVLDPGYLDEFVKEETEPAIPELHFAPLYEDLDQPVVTPFDLPEEEEPVAEEPAVEEPVVEEPVFEEPVLEEPVAEAPVVEEPVFEEPVFEEPVFEEPAAEEPEQDYYFKDSEPVEEPAAHELDYEKFDEADLTQYEEPAETAHYEDEYLSSADEAPVVPEAAEEVIEEPEFEEPVFEEPVAEEPAVEELVFEAPEFEEAVEEAPVVEEPVFEEPVFEEPVAEEPVVEEVPAEEPEQSKRWFDLPDFLKPREDRAPFEAIDETPVAVAEEERAEEEPAEEEPTVEDEYLDVPVIEGEDLVEQEEVALDDYLNEPEFEEAEAELPEIELPVEEEPAAEEPVFEAPEFEFTEGEVPSEETLVFEEPAFEAPEFEEPVFEAPVEEAVEEAEAEEPEADLADIYGNTEDEYLDISTERGVVTRSTISFDPDEYDDDDDEEDLPDTQDTFDENEPEDFEAAPVEEEAPAEEEKFEEEVAVDEQELFEEMEEEAPKKTGMTIAAPADKESEIEALKKRLAELMGADWEEPQKIEKEDKLDLEALVAEEPEQDYYYKDPEPAEVPASHDLDYEGYDEADLTQYEEPVENANYEDEYLKLADVEPAIEEVFAEEPEAQIPEEEEPAVEEAAEEVVVEEPVVEEAAEEVVVEEPVVEEKKTESIDDYLAAILAQEAAPVTRTSGLAADDQSLASVEDAYLDISEEKPTEVSEPAVEDLLAELPAIEEPAAEEPEVEVEEPVVEVEVPAVEEAAVEEPAIEEISIEEPEAEIPEVEVPAAAETVEDAAEEPVISSLEIEEPAVEAVPEKETDALTIEEIEQELFGETSTEGSAVETKKIDKFYTLYRKNEEFQRLLDEEYNKLKAAGDPAPEQILPDPEPPASAAKNGKQIEDATIYQDFEIPPEALAEAEAKAAAARENAPVKFEKAPAETAAVVAGAAAAGAAAVAAGTADKKADKKKEKEAPEVEYEEVDKGGGFLTALAVIIAILLVILLAIILLLNFAPDSAISIKIDSFIENITSHFTAVEVFGRQILL